MLLIKDSTVTRFFVVFTRVIQLLKEKGEMWDGDRQLWPEWMWCQTIAPTFQETRRESVLPRIQNGRSQWFFIHVSICSKIEKAHFFARNSGWRRYSPLATMSCMDTLGRISGRVTLICPYLAAARRPISLLTYQYHHLWKNLFISSLLRPERSKALGSVRLEALLLG